jgi:hypothetical protein
VYRDHPAPGRAQHLPARTGRAAKHASPITLDRVTVRLRRAGSQTVDLKLGTAAAKLLS